MANSFLVSVQNSLSTAASSVLMSIVSFIPTLLASLVVFFIGVVLANWLKAFIIKLLNVLHLSESLNRGTMKQFLQNAEITQKFENVIGELIRYLTILIFFIASVNLLGLRTVTEVLNSLLAYLPTIFASALILAAGVVLAGFLEKVIKGSLGGIDIKLSRLVAKMVSYLVVIFTILAAISQLGIAKSFIDTLFIGFVSMLALAFGLSLGLGSKDLVKIVLEDWYKTLKK